MLVRDVLTAQGVARAPIEFTRVGVDEDELPDVVDVALVTR